MVASMKSLCDGLVLYGHIGEGGPDKTLSCARSCPHHLMISYCCIDDVLLHSGHSEDVPPYNVPEALRGVTIQSPLQ